MSVPERLVTFKRTVAVGETKTARAPLILAPEFNEFLFEPIGADKRGQQVTVVSALARLDMDPWAEADRLSRLPDETAARSFSMVLSNLPDIALGIAGRQQTALRLVRLLPNRLIGSQLKGPIPRAAMRHELPRAIATGLFCAFAILLLGQAIWQTHHVAIVAAPTPITVQTVPEPHAPAGN
jgi:hypothetical protein